MASNKQREGRAERRANARAREREERRRRGAAAQRRAERRARVWRVLWRVTAVVAAVAVVAFAASRIWSSTGGKKTPGHLATATPLKSYAIDYRVVFTNGNVINTDHHVVNRPFRSLYTTTRDGKMVTGSIVNEKGLWFFQPPEWALINPGSAPGGDDPEPTLALRAGIAKHFVEVINQQTIIGRSCTMVRTGSPMGETMKKPTSRNHTDLCIDGNDLILDYRWTLDGKVVQTMRALKVDMSPDVSDAVFTPSPVNAAASPVTATALTEETRGKLSPKFNAPSELKYAGGWVRLEQGGGQTPVPRITETELFLHGDSDVIEVRRGPGDAQPSGFEVRIPGGRLAQLDLSIDRNTLTIPIGTNGAQAVRLVGRDPDYLIKLAESFVFS